MGDEVLVKVENVSKKFCRDLKKSLWYGVQNIAGELFGRNTARADLRPDEFWALKDISFELRRGESLGLIGRNGAGKSTLLRLLNGLIRPDEGCITVRGRVGALIELGAGFNPILTGRENIYVNAAVLGMSRKYVDKIIDDIIDFGEIEEFIDSPVQSYSSGMKVRLGFAIASHLYPDILLVDEVLAVGDVGFRRKCMDHMQRLLRDNATTIVFVSHDMRHVDQICDRAILLGRGEIHHDGPTKEAIINYLDELNRDALRRESTPGHETREGSGEIRFKNIIVDVPACNSEEIRMGDPIRIRAHYDCFSPRDYVRFVVGIEDTLTGTFITKGDCEVRDLSSSGMIVCVFPQINLSPRHYRVYVSATDNLQPFDFWIGAASFTVLAPLAEDIQSRVLGQEVLSLPFEMKCIPDNEAET